MPRNALIDGFGGGGLFVPAAMRMAVSLADWGTRRAPKPPGAIPESREPLAVILMLICGVWARFVDLSSASNWSAYHTESYHVAMSLASTGRFADPFGYPSGPTAHVGMLTPLPSAFVFWLFGGDSPHAEFVLYCWAAFLICLSIWLCWRLAVVLEAPRAARLAAVAVTALAPLQFRLETSVNRSWEINPATVVLIWILLKLAQSDTGVLRGRSLVLIGASTGFLFILNPASGVGAILSVALFHKLRVPFQQLWIAPLFMVLVGGSLAGFWAERNMRELGAPIVLRDNLALEVALSNHTGAFHDADPNRAYLTRFEEIHPTSMAPGELSAKGGEVAYYHALGHEVRRWIAAHPWEFLSLCGTRFIDFYLPPRWSWSILWGIPAHVHLSGLRQLVTWAAALGGLATLGVMAPRQRAYAYVLVAILGCSAPYIVVQPILRYRYMISALLIFCALDGAFRLAAHMRANLELGRRQRSAPGL
ncbi:MAG TPA: hypothetical protein VGG79_19580 [Roseiarcus sp.]|jgi:hypothetical protein